MEMLLTCQGCGNQFKYTKKSWSGVLPKYCSDTCRAAAARASRKKYIENAKDKKRAKSKLRQFEQVNIHIEKPRETPKENQKEVAYKREIMPTADTLSMEVLDFAMRLGQMKYEGNELLKKLNNLKSEQDKQDQQFLHLVESMDCVTIDQMKEIWQKEADNRTGRRDVKTLYSIVYQLIVNVPQNPHQYAKGLITKKDKLNEQYAQNIATKD